MPESYLPSRETDLNTWVSNFNNKISATPTTYGLTAAQATAFGSLYGAWRTSWAAISDPTTRTPSAIQTKNTVKEALIDGPGGIRELVAIIQAFPDTTDTMRVDLEITIPDPEPSPVPVPADPPVLTVTSTLGRTVELQLRDITDTEKRGKPEGVAGATILMFVGEDAPLDPMEWTFLQSTTRTTVEVVFPASVAPGAKVWLISFWKNRREETGPASVPVSTRVGDTMPVALAA